MAFVRFTGPDDASVLVNTDLITRVTRVPRPPRGAKPGRPKPSELQDGTRIYFGDSYQDVKELFDEVTGSLI